MSEKKKSWPVVGYINVREGSKGSFTTFNFNKDVEVFYQGQKLELDKYQSAKLVDPVVEVEQLIERGFIKENESEKRREEAANSGLKYKVVVPPPR